MKVFLFTSVLCNLVYGQENRVLMGKTENAEYYIYPQLAVKNNMGYSVGFTDTEYIKPQYDGETQKFYNLKRNQWLVDCSKKRIADINYFFYADEDVIDYGMRNAEDAIEDLVYAPKGSPLEMIVEDICKYSK